MLAPHTLNFIKGRSPRSIVIYGRNGTGKSSITDAWEWFHTEKIIHLAREGAGPSSYPHQKANQGDTFVEIEFQDESLGTIRLDYDHSRITKPNPSGNIDNYRSVASHPCHIRFEDLTRFVYFTKSEKYDALAQLMGFTPQVEFQKALKRVLREFSERLGRQKTAIKREEDQLKKLLSLSSIDWRSISDQIIFILSEHDIKPDQDSYEQIKISYERLGYLVANDPRSKELSDLGMIKRSIEATEISTEFLKSLGIFLGQLTAFKQDEVKTIELLLIDLYDKGQEIITKLGKAGEDTNICPLCGQFYEGDLSEHISEELEKLSELKKKRDEVINAQIDAEKLIPSDSLSVTLKNELQEVIVLTKKYEVDDYIVSLERIEKILKLYTDSIRIKPENINNEDLEKLQLALPDIISDSRDLNHQRNEIINKINKRINVLRSDESRRKLVNDHTRLNSALETWDRSEELRNVYDRLDTTYLLFDQIVDDMFKVA
jgi:tetratricopeptide (TPR) repeat protein